MQFQSKFVVTLCLGALLAGCGSSGPETPPLVPVTGTVTQGGKPVADAVVTFAPEKGSYSVGRTDEAGHFVLKYGGQEEGAVVGKHLVKISKMEGEAGDETIPRKFNEQSKLTYDVTQAGPNDFKIEI